MVMRIGVCAALVYSLKKLKLVSANMQEGVGGRWSISGMAFTTKTQGNENTLIGMCLSFQGQLYEIYPLSVSDLRAL